MYHNYSNVMDVLAYSISTRLDASGSYNVYNCTVSFQDFKIVFEASHIVSVLAWMPRGAIMFTIVR